MTDYISPRYISCVDTAKMIRKVLKLKFPKTKFFVRSSQYAGGASIDIDWIDGPTIYDVGEVTQNYAGSGFDPMIDLRFSYNAYLMPDNELIAIETNGTYGSMGTYPSITAVNIPPEAEKVHFMADHVFTKRAHSRALCERVASAFSDETK